MNKELSKEKTKKPETLEDCWKLIEKLVSRIEELEERLSSNSKNSSMPPSRDFKKHNPKKGKSGKHIGGQQGHQGHNRSLYPSEKADEIIECYPKEHCNCGGCVEQTKCSARRQILEIPKPKYLLLEYRIYSGKCSKCGKKATGILPEGIGNSWFGCRAHGLMSLLRSKYRQSTRQVKQFMSDFYDFPISLGSVSHVEERVSEALIKPREDVRLSIEKDNLPVHIDETGFRQNNKSGWAWILANKKNTYFALNKSRGKKVAKELLYTILVNGQGIAVSDRYAAYNFLPETKHQVCWAHLKRDFRKIAERAGIAGKIGRKLLKYYDLLFSFWQSEGHNRHWTLRRMRKKRSRWINNLSKWLILGSTCGHKTTERTCVNILACGKSLWNFFERDDVEPTNNLAERQLRPLVITKKLSFGAFSNRGARFIERIFTVIMTCGQQKIEVFQFLCATIRKHYSNTLGYQVDANLAST